jgi:hypothetical protein
LRHWQTRRGAHEEQLVFPLSPQIFNNTSNHERDWSSSKSRERP